MKEVVNSPIAVLILTIVTCGIYGFIWIFQVARAVESELDEKMLGGGAVILLTIITCGIYQLVWAYQMGEWLEKIGAKYGKKIENEGFIYLIVGLFFYPVSWLMIQTKINEIAGE